MTESWEVAVVAVWSILSLLLFLYLKAGFVLVKHAEVIIVERCGRYKNTLKPGVYWLWPGVDTARRVDWRYIDKDRVVRTITTHVDTRVHVIDFPAAHSVVTQDNVMIKVDSMVFFRISDARAAVYNISNLPDAIEVLTQSTLRDLIARMSLDETFSNRESLNAKMLQRIQNDCERWGISVQRVEVFNILTGPEILGAMEGQIKAERARRAKVLEADGLRESSIVRSRGDAANVVLLAEGARAKKVLTSEGQAAARVIEAEAEAAALSDIKAAVQSTGVKAVEYLTALRYLNGLSTLARGASNSQAILLPVESVDSIAKVSHDMNAAIRGQS